jgi:hypothetical protein
MNNRIHHDYAFKKQQQQKDNNKRQQQKDNTQFNPIVRSSTQYIVNERAIGPNRTYSHELRLICLDPSPFG